MDTCYRRLEIDIVCKYSLVSIPRINSNQSWKFFLYCTLRRQTQIKNYAFSYLFNGRVYWYSKV